MCWAAISTHEKHLLKTAPSDANTNGAVMTEAATTTPKLMRAKEACVLLGISRWTLNTLAHSGTVRTIKLASHKRYVIEDVMRLCDPDAVAAELISLQKAAEMIGGVSTRTVMRMADSGKLRSVRTPGGHRRVFAEDVRKVLTLEQGVNHAGTESDERADDPSE